MGDHMAKLRALLAAATLGALVAFQCNLRSEMRTAWIVMGCATALMLVTAGIAVLLSGHYRGK
jgi:hypothetical protein